MTNPFRKTEGVSAHHLSTARLYGILLLFLALSAYAIWKSERFQNMIQGVSQQRLSEALGRPVSFRTVDFHVFPPSVYLADVRVGNDPRLRQTPLLAAEEVSISGGVSLVGRQLRLGKVRAVHPRIALVQFPDGSWNLPPGLSGPSRGGVQVHIGSVLIQEGTLELDGRKTRLDGLLEGFAAELSSLPRGRSRGMVVARRATIQIPNAEPLVMALSARFTLDPRQGATVDDLLLEGPFGRIRATGALENFQRMNTVLEASGELSIEEVERTFRAELPFSGTARVRARVEIPAAGGFRITGEVRSPRVRAEQFVLEDFTASVVARPEELLARIERADYAAGRISGVLRIGNLAGAPQPMTLAAEAEGVSLERFFGDLGLKGTGLSGSIGLTAALRWGKGGLRVADGGGLLRLAPGPASSLVKGRFGVPTSGGGPLSVVNGRIGFESTTLRFSQSSLELQGGMKIGFWQPDFDWRLRCRDLAEVDHLFQNFVGATGGRPEPLGLGGSGQLEGHLAGAWSDPEATALLNTEDVAYANVSFGSVRGTVDMRGGAFYLRPLRAYDGEASLSLEGMARYRTEPGLPHFDLAISAHAYPVSRLLEYLRLPYPVEGLLSGSFPVAGTPEEVTGGGPVELTDAVLWGQKVPRLTGIVHLTPGRFAIEELRAQIGGGVVGGGGSIAIREKTFEARFAGDGVSLSAVDAWKTASLDGEGKLSFQFSGSGLLDRPDATVSAALSQASFFGHAVPEGGAPRLEATVRRGIVESSLSVPGKWNLTAGGDLFGVPARLTLALEAEDLNSFLLLTPMTLPAGLNGSLSVDGSLEFPEKAGQFPSGTFTVTRARLDASDRPGLLATSGPVRASLSAGRLVFDDFEVAGAETTVKVAGSLNIGKTPMDLDMGLSGPLDASLLGRLVPELPVAGRLRLNLKATGALDRPSLVGSIRLEDGKYRLPGLNQIADDIHGNITLTGSRGELDARARLGGGEASAAGNFGFDGLSIRDFRFAIQGRHVSVRYPEDLRLLVDAELLATGGPTGNVIRGQLVLLRGTYSRDFEVTLSDLLEQNRPSGVAAREPWKERTTLEVRVVSSASLEVRNNFARLTGTVDLMTRGTLEDPVLVGQIVLDEGGRVTFRDVPYEIDSGSITFAGSKTFAPILDLRTRTELKGYSLIVNLAGTWPRLQTTFSSDPPLPDESVIALLLTGERPVERTAASGSLETAAGGIVGSAATGVITRPAQRLLRLERFQIDPLFTAAGFSGATATVGKQVSSNWLVTYSQPLFEAENRLPILQVEGRLSQTWILRAVRDENGI
ncbi:MAG TPA: translocation/assembly module TamB domain-containing protein, partial [Thermoanaerobaculia bacterium]|nr:translocation/assembly module TamB domain-containing protein [Thermoanaerobaculia bacterium]